MSATKYCGREFQADDEPVEDIVPAGVPPLT